MSMWTAICKPGRGRRQSGLSARVKAANCRLGTENQRLRQELAGAQQLIEGLRLQLADSAREHHGEVQAIAYELGEVAFTLLAERDAHASTRRELDRAVRANESNANAETVQTDVSVLRAAVADEFVDAPAPGPEYAPHTRLLSPRTVTVMTLPEAFGVQR